MDTCPHQRRPRVLIETLAAIDDLELDLAFNLSARESDNFLKLAIYEGVKSFYKEDDETIPVNTYGKSKVAAEKLIASICANYAVLRSSIIYGPQTISLVEKSLPIQAIDDSLRQGQEVKPFHDEFCCPIYVEDMVNVILLLIKKWTSESGQMQLLLKAGGPDRVSRLQMAETVATIRGYDHSLIKPVSASTVNRGVASPPDISMDISRLVQVLGFTPRSFQDGIRITFETE